MPRQQAKLSVFDAAILVVGIVFGSGIFVAPQIIASFCQSTWLSLLAWPLGALIAMCGSMCYAESLSRVEGEGGFYAVFRAVYGERFAATAGLVSQIVISPAALAGPMTIGGAALATSFLGQPAWTLSCTLGLLLLAAALNATGTHFSKIAQRAFVAAKVLLVLLLIASCLVARSMGGAHAQAATDLPHAPFSFAHMAAFFGVLLWTFDGWTDVTFIASRLRNPGKDLPKALLLGLLGLAGIFVAVQFSVMSILGAAGTAHSAQPFSAAIQTVFGDKSRLLVDGAIVLSTFTSAHGVMWMVSSLTRVMSDQGALPRALGRTDLHLQRPIACVSFVSCLAAGICLLGDFSTIVALFSFFIWVFYGLMALSVVLLRRRGTSAAATWQAPGGLFCAAVVAITSISMTVSHVAAYPTGCAAAVAFFAVLMYARRFWAEPAPVAAR